MLANLHDRCAEHCPDPDFHPSSGDAVSVLAPIIFILCVVGVFATPTGWFDTYLMLGLGIGGLSAAQTELSGCACGSCYRLGPLTERSMRQSLISSQGDPMTSWSVRSHCLYPYRGWSGQLSDDLEND